MKIKVSKHKLNIHYLACTCLPFFLVKILFASNLHVHVSARMPFIVLTSFQGFFYFMS